MAGLTELEVIAHRANLSGANPSEENSLEQIEAALRQGFSVEIDIRERDGRAFLSHDAEISERAPDLNSVLDLLAGNPVPPLHALNVKDESGLVILLAELERRAPLAERVFLFDFELALEEPERWMERARRLVPVAARISQTEGDWERSIEAGYRIFWLDCWQGDLWYDESLIDRLHRAGAAVLAVSPDLHLEIDRDALDSAWARLAEWGVDGICTDFPIDLAARFGDEAGQGHPRGGAAPR
jgi:glycerophosphoryl diester phosphodiesterase